MTFKWLKSYRISKNNPATKSALVKPTAEWIQQSVFDVYEDWQVSGNSVSNNSSAINSEVNYSQTYGLSIYVAFQYYLAKEKLSIHLKGKFINVRNSPKLSKSHFHPDGIQLEQVPDSFLIWSQIFRLR